MRHIKLFATAALAVALYTGVTVTAATSARTLAQATPCVPAMAGGDVFSVYSKLTPAEYGRGFEQREPAEGSLDSDLPAAAKGKAGANFRARVAGVLPRRHRRLDRESDEHADLGSDDRAQRQLRGVRVAPGPGFNFTLAGVTRTDNAAWFYAGPGGTDEHSMKQALHQGGDNALNLYSTTAGPYLGWAYLPDITTKPGQAYLDGIVIDWESMPGTSTTYAGRYDEGKTVTHETGHWLEPRAHVLRRVQREGRLRRRHTGGEDADLGLPDRQGHLLRAGLDPIHNYMDYSYDSCYTEFTARPGSAHARRLVALPRVLGSFLQGGALGIPPWLRSRAWAGRLGAEHIAPSAAPTRGWRGGRAGVLRGGVLDFARDALAERVRFVRVRAVLGLEGRGSALRSFQQAFAALTVACTCCAAAAFALPATQFPKALACFLPVPYLVAKAAGSASRSVRHCAAALVWFFAFCCARVETHLPKAFDLFALVP